MFITQNPVPTYTHLHASDGVYIDTETTLRYYSDYVWVTVRMLSGVQWASEPAPKTLLEWVDDVVSIESSVSKVRSGRRIHASGWNYRYSLKGAYDA